MEEMNIHTDGTPVAGDQTQVVADKSEDEELDAEMTAEEKANKEEATPVAEVTAEGEVDAGDSEAA